MTAPKSNALQVVRPAVQRTPLSDVIRLMIADGELGEKGGKCIGFSVLHVVQGTAGKEVDAIKLGGKDYTPESLADRIEARAKTHAQDLPGWQTFLLQAHYSENAGAPGASHPFGCNGRMLNYDDQGNLVTEAADGKGALAQAMRLEEIIVQRTFGAISGFFEEQRLERQELRADVRESRRENREMFVLLRQAAMDSAQLSHQKRMEELEYQRGTAERQLVGKMIPALTNTIAGKEVFPQSMQDTSLVEGLIEALSSDQVDEQQVRLMLGMLPPALAGPLTDRLHKALETKRLNSEARARVKGSLADTSTVEHELGEDPEKASE